MDADQLSSELRYALFRRVTDEWDRLNWAKFRSRLKRPSFELFESTTLLGRWTASNRVLGLSNRLVRHYTWSQILATLEHEMAHQYVDEVLGGEPEPHGPLYRKVCQERGIDFGARLVGGPAQSTDEDDRIIVRVQKLLALAQSSNQHEAELAANTARRVMLRFNLQSCQEPTAASRYTKMTLGQASGRTSAHQYAVASVLATHFFVEVLWSHHYDVMTGKSGSILEVFGRPENLKMAEFVHAFLHATAERLWQEHKKTQGIKADRDRRAYLLGVIRGFDRKLEQDRRSDAQEGLVWLPDAGLEDYFRRCNPRIVRTGTSAVRNTDAYAQGRAAGQGIVLSRPIEGRGDSGRSGPRALPRGRS